MNKAQQSKFISVDVLRNLATSLKGLQTQSIHHVDSFPVSLSTLAETHSNTLAIASYRFGSEDLSFGELKDLAKMAPRLKALGFNWKAASHSLITHHIDPGFKSLATSIAVRDFVKIKLMALRMRFRVQGTFAQ